MQAPVLIEAAAAAANTQDTSVPPSFKLGVTRPVTSLLAGFFALLMVPLRFPRQPIATISA
jgi:hypothetical protein